MELKERAEIVRNIRIGEISGFEKFITLIDDIFDDYPLEHHEHYYENLRDEFLENFPVYNAKIIFIYTIALLLLNDFEFMHFFERDSDFKNIKVQIVYKFRKAKDYLNNEFTKKYDDIVLLKLPVVK
jgi:hypothetical protein